jgi:hypothetical protein
VVEGFGWGVVLAAVLLTIYLMDTKGTRVGVRTAWFIVVFAVPAWWFVNVRSLRVEPLAAVALTGLGWTLLRPFRGWPTRWVLSDICLVLLVGSCFLSDLVARSLIPGTVLDSVRLWILPYALGRLLFADADDVRQTLPLLGVLALGLGAFAILEAFTKVNIPAQLSGMRWELLEQGEGYRWGLKRAQVTRNHPIYFGLLMCLLLPWLLVAYREVSRGRGAAWWQYAPLAGIVGAILSIARSAHVALLLVLGSDLFFRRPAYRVPMAVGAAVLVLLVSVYYTETLDLMGQLIGEEEIGSDRVTINGIVYDYTGTRHRELLVLAYDEATERAGWLGYGSNLIDMPVDPKMDPRFVSVDHHYLLHYLRFGWLGVLTFGFFVVCSTWNLACVAWRHGGIEAELAGGLCGAFVAVALMLRGLAFAEDFGALWLFIAGWGAGRRATQLQRLPIPSETAN